MTCKKFWQTKNSLRRACAEATRSSIRASPNVQLTRGAPRQQFEGGVEVPEEHLRRVFGHGATVIESIKRAHPCVIGVFKKGRPQPLVHVVAFSQHHLDGALRCIRDAASREPERHVRLRVGVSADVKHLADHEVAQCASRYPHTTITFEEESEEFVICGPQKQATNARTDIQFALPKKVSAVVHGPAGVLIGSCGETIWTVRSTFSVEVVVSGNAATITGFSSSVGAAVAWYRELFSDYKHRHAKWAAMKQYKRAKRQSSAASIGSDLSSNTSSNGMTSGGD